MGTKTHISRSLDRSRAPILSVRNSMRCMASASRRFRVHVFVGRRDQCGSAHHVSLVENVEQRVVGPVRHLARPEIVEH